LDWESRERPLSPFDSRNSIDFKYTQTLLLCQRILE